MQSIESLWPIAAGTCFLLLAAWKQWTVERVPNRLTGLFFLGALVTAGCTWAGLFPALEGGPWSAFAGCVVGGGVLLPLYARGKLGAGCVKAQALFGAWVGCAISTGSCIFAMLGTTIVAIVLTLMMANACNSIQDEETRQRYLFPAQVTLSVGSLLAFIGFWFIA